MSFLKQDSKASALYGDWDSDHTVDALEKPTSSCADKSKGRRSKLGRAISSIFLPSRRSPSAPQPPEEDPNEILIKALNQSPPSEVTCEDVGSEITIDYYDTDRNENTKFMVKVSGTAEDPDQDAFLSIAAGQKGDVRTFLNGQEIMRPYGRKHNGDPTHQPGEDLMMTELAESVLNGYKIEMERYRWKPRKRADQYNPIPPLHGIQLCSRPTCSVATGVGSGYQSSLRLSSIKVNPTTSPLTVVDAKWRPSRPTVSDSPKLSSVMWRPGRLFARDDPATTTPKDEEVCL